MAISQSATIKPTAFPEDIKVGQDVPKLGAVSSGILGIGVGGETSARDTVDLGAEDTGCVA